MSNNKSFNFGYSNSGKPNWANIDAYSDKEIETIKDPEGGVEVSLPTAIPSPFARIDLVKTAFRNISKTPALKAFSKEGDVIASKEDEKLVSDALDLAEILFNIDNMNNVVKIIVWDKDAELANLKASSDMHRRFGETLELYLDQDEKAYNFDLLTRLYLIEYNHKIIGCTSPSTMFFTTANDLTHAQIRLTKSDTTFDGQYTPLYEREVEFQKYFHTLMKSETLSKRLAVMTEYLSKNIKAIESLTKDPETPTEKRDHFKKLLTTLNTLKLSDLKSNYTELDTISHGNVVEVLGVTLYKRKKGDIAGSLSKSDFLVQSNKYKGGLMPLALQNNLNKPFRYANDNWRNSTKVPFIDSEAFLEKRWLPDVKIQYPYLTVSDFLEPYLIRLVYPINKEKFFDGNVLTEVGDDSKGFILPIKKQFFDYFNSADLISSLTGKPKIEMVQGAAGTVKVTLKIPVAKPDEYISFERIYYQSPENQLSKPDEEKNKGVIVEHQFGITLFPFIKASNPDIEAYYRIQLVDRDVTGVLKNTEYDLKFFSNNSADTIEIRAKKIRSSKKTDAVETATSQYYVLHNEFDFIQVSNLISSGASGIIIPNWQPHQQGNEVFSFAVDFGTTNTHVEYKIGNGSPKPFDINQTDIQIATLFDPARLEGIRKEGADAIYKSVEYEFVPRIIGKDVEFRFPQRTVVSESHTLNVETETFTLADFNIPFIYEKYEPGPDARIHSNLKWAKREMGNEKRIRAFFEKLIMLMRNKVLMNRGNLSQTKLVWFYPSSMKPARKSSLEDTWNELFQHYFNPTSKPIGISESLAPFYYFKGANKIQGGAYKPVVSIDIGGGTTDIVVFKSNKPLLLTSFKFAANTIFGDGFSEYGAASSNGIINKYFPYFENLLSTNKQYDLVKVLSSIKDKNKTEDLNAFFFSIENNWRIKDKKLFSYNSLLANDEDLKILFVYFYSAIIYHIAAIMKNKGIELPTHLIFSGTGSKVLGILTPNVKILVDLSKKIFESVYEQAFDTDGLTIETERSMPKEVTCKGGLMSNPGDLAIKISDIQAILTCLEQKGIDKLTYDKLDDATKADIATYVRDFNSFFLKLNSQYNFDNYFNVSEESLEIFKSELNKHLRDYLEEGLAYTKKMDDVTTNEKEIEETLFFYPLIGTINNLSNQLSGLTPVIN